MNQRELRARITPGLVHCQQRYQALLDKLVVPATDWLDIGCGYQFYPEWLPDSLESQKRLVSRCHSAVGIDRGDDRPHVALKTKYAGSADHLFFDDHSFSLVTANMVVEHLEEPEQCLREIYRVLRPNGLFVFHTPNLASPWMRAIRCIPDNMRTWAASLIDGRKETDIFPTYYRLNHRRDVEAVAQQVGFSVVSLKMVESSPVIINCGAAGIIPELLLIRLLRRPKFINLRHVLLVTLGK